MQSISVLADDSYRASSQVRVFSLSFRDSEDGDGFKLRGPKLVTCWAASGATGCGVLGLVWYISTASWRFLVLTVTVYTGTGPVGQRHDF